jgi:hypothetical protein
LGSKLTTTHKYLQKQVTAVVSWLLCPILNMIVWKYPCIITCNRTIPQINEDPECI